MEAGREADIGDALLDRLRARRGARRARSRPRCAQIAALPDPVGEVIDGRPPAERPRRAQGARAARRRRGRLRGAPERHDRRRRAVPEVGQRDRAARLLDGRALQPALARDRRRGGRRAPACPRAASASSPAAGARSSPSSPRSASSVDLIIPRGGEGLKEALQAVATVPVIYAASGNCHVFVDAAADLEQALAIVLNAKLQRPGVCNAAETLLVHAAIARPLRPAWSRRRCARPA